MEDKEGKTEPASQPVIQPVDFTPPGADAAARRKPIKPLVVVLVVALVLSGLALWFLLTAKSLIVRVEPVQAEVEIEGLAFRLSDYFLLRRGEYRVTAEAEGYQPADETIQVGEADSQILELVLQKLPGHLAVQSQPEAAEVYLDGRLLGTTPLREQQIAVGEYQLEVKKKRYLPFTGTVVIEGMDKTLDVSAQLQPGWGFLEINSEPEGAQVSIAGEERGVTPLATELLMEPETVELSLDGYKPWQQQLSVAVGETLQPETVQLQPADGVLKLTTRPVGASVTVDGKFRGVTPLTLALNPGEEYRIRLFLDGYQRIERRLTLTSGIEQQVNETLRPNNGTLRVTVNPQDAEVLIDGVVRGTSGATLTLPARAHRLEVRREGYASDIRTVTPRVGIEQVLQIKLQTETAARWAKTPRQIKTVAGQPLKLFRPQNTFTMGASRREAGRRANEVIRKVRLDRPFYLSLQPVTNTQYKRFDKRHSSSHSSGETLDTPSQPVVRVSWLKAAQYCNWLSEQEQLTPFYQQEDGKITGINAQANGYRLPTEAEWAWAARYQSGAMLKYPWGGQFPPTVVSGNYADQFGSKILGKVLARYRDNYIVSAPVGRFRANSKGLHDLGSNVSEWVSDYYGTELGLSLKEEVDPLGPEKGDFRVIRGASWRDSDVTELRLSYRDYGVDGKDDIGFRVARYVE